MGKATKEGQNYSKQPFLLSVDEIVDHLETKTDSGLSASQAKQYEDKYGENRLESDGGIAWYAILGKQVSNAMILVSLQHHSFQIVLLTALGTRARYGAIIRRSGLG